MTVQSLLVRLGLTRAKPDLPLQATQIFQSNGRRFRYRRYREAGHADVFSGMYEHSKWLLLDDLVAVLGDVGLPAVEIVERHSERNGARVLLYAARIPETPRRGR